MSGRHWRSMMTIAFDANGGFFQCLKRDGRVFDRETRTLVGSARAVFNYAMAWRHFGEARHREGDAARARRPATPAISIPKTGRYAWRVVGAEVRRPPPTSATASPSCCSPMRTPTVPASRRRLPWIYETRDLMERRFWLPQDALYASEGRRRRRRHRLSRPERQHARLRGDDRRVRGDRRRLVPEPRAAGLAEAFTVRLAAETGGTVWEHFPRRLVAGSGVRPRRHQQPHPAVGRADRASDRMGQATAHSRSPRRRGLATPACRARSSDAAIETRLGRSARRPHLRLRSRRRSVRSR